MNDQQERHAIARLKAGDVRALTPFIKAHQQRALRTAYLITQDAALAEDVTQAAFIRAYEGIAHFDASPIERHPRQLDLRLELRGGFVFEFRVPFNAGLTLLTDIMQEEANGVTVTLKWLKLAPSMTRLYFCYNLPAGGERWYPALMRLSFDGQRVAREAGASYSLAGAQQVSENEWCQEQAFLTAYTALPREVTFTLDGLQTPIFYSEANMQRAAEVYAQYGIEAQVMRNPVQETTSYMLNFPNMTASADVFEEASAAANAAMGDPLSGKRFAGEWTFTVQPPPTMR